MDHQFSLYLLGFILASVIALTLTVLAFQRRDQRTAVPTVVMLAACTTWAAADAVRIGTTNETASLLAHNVRFVGSTFVVAGIVMFVLSYTGRDRWLEPRWIAALTAPFLLMLALVWTEPLGVHSLVRADVRFVETAGLTVAEFDWGPWFFVNAVYSYILLLGSFFLFIQEYFRQSEQTYRRQILALTLAMLVPWSVNGAHLAGLTPFDMTAIGLVFTGIMFYASLFWFQLLDLVPIARGTVVDNLEHGFLVVDEDWQVVDVNDQALILLDSDRDAVLGAAAADLFAPYPAVTERLGEEDEFTVDITVERTETRHYEVELTDVQTGGDREIGRVMLIRDVTKERRRERKLEERTERLERQNEQLDQFASIVSHDLRNPINVARGYLDIARESGEDEHFAEVEESLDRMEEIIEDVLKLARSGQEVSETEPIDLSAVATEAWDRVDTEDATLELDVDVVVEADRGRLQQLLENLFRNALDHGPADVQVTVTGSAEGFVVADDGPGIPPEEREEVFDQGYTTAEEGTGLGLSIVSAIVEAHDWSIRVTESDGGGACFEIEDVATPEQASPEAV